MLYCSMTKENDTSCLTNRLGRSTVRCQILHFSRFSTCVEAHWFRMHRISIRYVVAPHALSNEYHDASVLYNSLQCSSGTINKCAIPQPRSAELLRGPDSVIAIFVRPLPPLKSPKGILIPINLNCTLNKDYGRFGCLL